MQAFKKLLALLLALAMVFALAACADKDDDDDDDDDESSSSSKDNDDDDDDDDDESSSSSKDNDDDDDKKSKNSPETAMDALIDYTNGDIDKLEDLAPKAYWDYMEEEEDLDLDEYIEEMQEYYEEYVEEYGKDTISLVDMDEEELDEDDLEAIKDALSDAYDIDPDSVTDGCILEYEVEKEYSDGEKESEDGEFHCLKIDGKWYIVMAYEYDGEWEVYFMN